jgi:hypothetical protein
MVWTGKIVNPSPRRVPCIQHLRRSAFLVFGIGLALVLVSGCSCWSCYELGFAPQKADERWFIPIEVTRQDEARHPAFAWIGDQVAHGRTSGSRRGRWLVDDLWAMSKERNVDPSAVRQPLFIIRGTPLLLKPLDHCLLF